MTSSSFDGEGFAAKSKREGGVDGSASAHVDADDLSSGWAQRAFGGTTQSLVDEDRPREPDVPGGTVQGSLEEASRVYAVAATQDGPSAGGSAPVEAPSDVGKAASRKAPTRNERRARRRQSVPSGDSGQADEATPSIGQTVDAADASGRVADQAVPSEVSDPVVEVADGTSDRIVPEGTVLDAQARQERTETAPRTETVATERAVDATPEPQAPSDSGDEPPVAPVAEHVASVAEHVDLVAPVDASVATEAQGADADAAAKPQPARNPAMSAPPTRASVESLYRAVLRREADEQGLGHQVAEAATLEECALNLASSGELTSRFPSLAMLSPADRVDYLSTCDERMRGQHGGVAVRFHPDVVDMIADKSRLGLVGSVIDPQATEVVVGMTTLGRPSLAISLRSLLDQRQADGSPFVARIVLNVPRNVTLSDEARALVSANPNVEVRRTRNWGPVTKLIETLRATTNPDAVVLLADDDVAYPALHFSTLVGYYLAMGGKWAVCASGFDWNGEVRRSFDPGFVPSSYGQVEGHLQQVHVIETWCGVALRRGWFEDDFVDFAEHEAIVHPDLMRTDDGFYSTYLELRGVGKLNVNDTFCNRYDTGFDGETQAVIHAANGDMPSLNGNGPTSMQWVRYADHCMRIQADVFTHCRAPAPGFKALFLSVCVGEEYAHKTRCGNVSKAAYCRRYGHDFREVTRSLAPDLPLIWTKIVAIRQALDEGYDHVFYTDADVVITNPCVNFGTLVARARRDIVYTFDCNGPNIGTLLVRNTPRAKAFLDDLLAMEGFHYNDPWYEQAAFVNLIREGRNADVAEGFEQRMMNSYVFCWHHNDFLVHLAGIYGGAVPDVMDAINRIVYVDRKVRPSTMAVLSRFLHEYAPDPHFERHLTPRYGRNDRDTYVDANHGRDGRRDLLVISSTSPTLKRVVRDVLLHSGRAVSVASESERRADLSPSDWLSVVKFAYRPGAPLAVFDLDAVASHAGEVLDVLARDYNLKVVLLDESCTVLGAPSPVGPGRPVPPAERSIRVGLSAFLSDAEAEVHRLRLFTGVKDLEETFALYGSHPKLDMGPDMVRALAALATRAGAKVERDRPFAN